MIEDDGLVKVVYSFFKFGNNLLNGVWEEKLILVLV